MLCPVVGSPVHKRHGHTGPSQLKGCKSDEEIGTSVIQREAERAQTIQQETEKDQRDLIRVYKYLFRGVKMMEPEP